MGVETLIDGKLTSDFIDDVAQIILAERKNEAPASNYSETLSAATKAFQPPFGDPSYAERFADASPDREGMAQSLIFNAQRKPAGKTRSNMTAAC